MLNTALMELKIARTKIPAFINVTVVGLLAGLCFCVQFGLLPSLNRMDASSYVAVMHGIIPAFTQVVKPLMVMGSITFLIRLLWLRSPCARAQYWILAAFVFFVAGAVITVTGHFPINR